MEKNEEVIEKVERKMDELKKEEEMEKNKVEVLKIVTQEIFYELIKSASEMLNEAKIEFSNNGMSLIGMDPANICMVAFKLSKEEFTEYQVEENPTVIINISDLAKRLKEAGTKDTTIELVSNHLKLSNGRKKFSIPLLTDEGDKTQKVPELTYEGSFEPDKSIKADIKILASLKESLNIKMGSNGMSISHEGILPANFEIEGKVIDCTKEVEVKFSEDYLLKILSLKGDIKKLEVKTDYPLTVTYEYGKIILAPRISNE